MANPRGNYGKGYHTGYKDGRSDGAKAGGAIGAGSTLAAGAIAVSIAGIAKWIQIKKREKELLAEASLFENEENGVDDVNAEVELPEGTEKSDQPDEGDKPKNGQ